LSKSCRAIAHEHPLRASLCHGTFSIFGLRPWQIHCVDTKASMAQKILIVEDNVDFSELLSMFLRPEGYVISLARNWAQGIDKALLDRPDLIITDLFLPDMTGLDAANELKRNPVTTGIPVVVLTGTSHGDWKAQALKAGIAEYLIKPVSRHDLLKVVCRIIQSTSLIDR
jgi:CheY-like chemotaxis protein